MLLDEEPVTSCLELTVSAAGRGLTTVEGLATGGAFGELLQAFVEKNALQCGVCIPGFLVNATASLRQNSNPTEEEVRY